jgi:Lhr-like helicase
MTSKVVIIQDTHEKTPWDLTFYGFQQVARHLVTGDYSVEGLEDAIVIERKKTPAELAKNLGYERDRFERELLRMEDYRFRYLICEFTAEELAKFPVGANIPAYLKRKIRIKGKYMISRINQLCEEHGIELIFTNNKSDAEVTAVRLINEAMTIIHEEQQDNS